MLSHPRDRFDFILPDEPDQPLDTTVPLLPVGLVDTILRRHLRPEFAFIESLASRYGGPTMIQVETPPPLPTTYIQQYPAGFEQRILETGVSPLPFRYKLWRAHSAVVRQHCATTNMAFLPSPPEARDLDGSLAAPYRRVDPTHGNGLYGHLVLNQIRQHLGLDLK